MRSGKVSPPFPGFDLDSDVKVPVSYLNIYFNDILDDWNVICEVHQTGINSRLERFDASYNNDGSIRDLHLKVISEKETGFNHCWIQLLSSRKIYLAVCSGLQSCSYYNDLIKAQEFFSLWSELDLRKMKPKGNFEWFEFRFQGEKIPYAMENTRKYLIKDHQFLQFGNENLPVTGYFISSYGMARKGPIGRTFEAKEYQDYFFGVS